MFIKKKKKWLHLGDGQKGGNSGGSLTTVMRCVFQSHLTAPRVALESQGEVPGHTFA